MLLASSHVHTGCCRHCRVILLIAFLFAMSMVLLNLLIALMSDAASKVRLNHPSPFARLVGALLPLTGCHASGASASLLPCCGPHADLHHACDGCFKTPGI